MKYYAVTNDPNELMHFGIKGMKWGVLRTPEQLGHPRHYGNKPRSDAYKRASAKLNASMKNGINRVKAKWNAYNSPENKQLRAYRKYEKQTNKAIEQARRGKLKYGKLTDDQVQRVTDRLAMERNARMLSETEKTWGKRLRESIGEGIISGVGQGFGRRTSEWIARGSTLKTDRMRKEQMNKMDLEQHRKISAMDLEKRRAEAQQQRKLDRQYELEKMKNERKDAKQKATNQINAEYYLEAAKRGYNHPYLNAIASGQKPSIQTNRERAKQLAAWNSRNAEENDYKQREKLQRETFDKAYYAAFGRRYGENAADAPYGKTSDRKNAEEYPRLMSSSSYSVSRNKMSRAITNPSGVLYAHPDGTLSYENPERVKSKKGGYRKKK